MILQSLVSYYERKSTDPDAKMPTVGFEKKRLPFILELDESGRLVQIRDTRRDVDGRKIAAEYMVPMGGRRDGPEAHTKPHLLWDSTEFALGISGRKDPPKPSNGKLKEKAAYFLKRVESLSMEHDPAIRALLKFLRRGVEAEIIEMTERDGPADFLDKSANISFQLNGDEDIVCCRPSVREFVAREAQERMDNSVYGERGICLVTGSIAPRVKIHKLAIKGVYGQNAQSPSLVSFNSPSFSYRGKTQGENAPIGEYASFAYTTALNYLMNSGNSQKVKFGDSTAVFWADKEHRFEDDFAGYFDEPPKDDPDRQTKNVRALLRSVETGSAPPRDLTTRFFILGLSPNQARIAVRFFHAGTVAELSRTLALHFEDLRISHPPHMQESLPIRHLMQSIAILGRDDRVRPGLAGEWIRTILSGMPYPQILLQAAVMRNKHAGRPQSWKETLHEYCRMAIMKGSLNRKARARTDNPNREEFEMMLDASNTNLAYNLGRLFAVLEMAQQNANPEINTTIRDRYYASASTTPGMAFPNLFRLKNNHLKKIDNKGQVIFFERLIGEIVGNVSADGLPSHLSQDDQARFAIGYYHQRQDLFKKRDAD